MGTNDARVYVKLNKLICSRGIRSVPRRVHVRIARRRNDEEDAEEELFSLVTVAEVQPEGLWGRHFVLRSLVASCLQLLLHV